MAEPALIQNRTCDKINLGESASLSRTIGRRGTELYGAISGDANPTDLDEAFANGAHVAGVVAAGMLTAGLISNLLGDRLPGAGAVYLGQELRLAAPVLAGATVTLTVTATEKRADGATSFACPCELIDAPHLSLLACADAVSIVLGARVPMIPTSRADGARTRMASAAVAGLYAHNRRQAVG